VVFCASDAAVTYVSVSRCCWERHGQVPHWHHSASYPQGPHYT